MATSSKKYSIDSQNIIKQYEQLRNEQRSFAETLNTLEMDLKEHNTVLEMLKSVDPERICYRQIGGVLCQRTVKEVLPQLMMNMSFFEGKINQLKAELVKKELEIKKLFKDHDIKPVTEKILMKQDETSNSEEEPIINVLSVLAA